MKDDIADERLAALTVDTMVSTKAADSAASKDDLLAAQKAASTAAATVS